jgi:DNA-binding NarL/FixJ family response regulator
MPTAPRATIGFPELLTTEQWREVSRAHGLTPQELRLLRLLARGFANCEIAFQLGLRRPTVRSHLRSIYRKLNCTDRIEVLLQLVHEFR